MEKMTFDVVCSLNEVIDGNMRAFDDKAKPKVNKVVAINMTGTDGNETIKTIKRIKYLTRKKIVHGQVENDTTIEGDMMVKKTFTWGSH